MAALCRALDGMALAIELAAARFPALGLDGLESGLDQRLRFLTAGTGRPDRHGSLREAIGWSYDLLSADDRALLRGVAVFASWFDVDAACAVAGGGRERAEVADGLARLAEHSLLVVERGEPTRYRALETIRQYGVEQLDAAGELDRIRAGHERWCRLAAAELGRTDARDIDEAWCARFDRVVDDVGAALAWSAGDESATGGRRRSWPPSSPGCCSSAAGRRRRSGGTSRPPSSPRRSTERVAYLRLAAGSAASRFVGDEALRLFRMAADAAVPAGDRAGAARDLATMAMYINRAPGIMATQHSRAEADALVAEARALSDGSPLAQAALAVAEFGDQPAVGDARRVAELAERAGDGILHSIALDLLTLACLVDDDIAEAVRVARRRLELLDTLAVGPLSGFEFGDGHLMAAEVDLAAGDLAGAAAHARGARRPALLPRRGSPGHVPAPARRRAGRSLRRRRPNRRALPHRLGARGTTGRAEPGPLVLRRCDGARHARRRRPPGGLGAPDHRPRRRRRATRRMPSGVGPRCSTACSRSIATTRPRPYGDSRPTSTTPSCSGPWAAGRGGPGTPRCGRRPPYSTTTPMRRPASTGAGTPPATTRSQPPSSNAPRAIATGDRDALVRLAITFAQLGCPYQQARTGRIAAGMRE